HDPAATVDGTLPRRERTDLVPGPDRRGHRRVPAPAGGEVCAHGRDAGASPAAPQHVRGAGLHPADFVGLRMRSHRGMPARHGGGGWSDRDREPPPAVLAAPPRQDQRPAGPHPTAHHPHPAGPDPVAPRHPRRRQPHGRLPPPRPPPPPAAPGRAGRRTGTSAAAVTVTDDRDTASIQIAEDLAPAWACSLRSTHAADPVTETVTAGPAPTTPAA